MKRTIMYVGCFTATDRGGTGNGGIAVYEKIDKELWRQIQLVEQFNPSFLAMSENKRFLYGVQGMGKEIYAYEIDEHTGKLTFLNNVEAGAGLACEVCDGFLYAAAGDIQIYRLCRDGSIGERVQKFMPEGEVGPIPKSQKSAQPHHVLHDPQGKNFAVPCRGMDVIHIYRYDAQSNLVKSICALRTYGGSHPRHIVFHPAKPVAYQLLERYGMVLVCHYKEGILSPVEMMPTVSPQFVGLFNAAAEIFIHPNGQLLAISNRGDNSIAMYRIMEDGCLRVIGWTHEQISVPRFFTFDSDGEYLYCANIGRCDPERPMTREGDVIPDTGSITIYRVNKKSGELEFTGERIEIPAPSYILFKEIHDEFSER